MDEPCRPSARTGVPRHSPTPVRSGGRVRAHRLAGLLLLAPWWTLAQAQSLAEVVREALAQYPAVAAARAGAAGSASEVERAKASRWPTVGVGATALEQEAAPRRLVATPQASYTVYAGGGIEAGVARAEALRRAAEGRTASTLDEVGLQAAEAYIVWARQLEIVQLARENVQALQRIRDDVRRIVEADPGRMVDLSQAEVRVSAAALALEQRESDLAQAAARLSRFWPRALPGRPDGLEEEPGERPASLGQALAFASERHPLLVQGLAQVEAAEAAVAVARAQTRPRVELQLSHQLNPYTLRPGLNTQLNVNMPVFNAGAGAAGVAAADAQARAARAAAEEQGLAVRERITAAWSEWQSAQRRESLNEGQDRAAQRVVEGYQLQFRLARRSLLDLLNIQAEAHGYAVASAGARAERRLARFRLAASLAELGRVYAR